MITMQMGCIKPVTCNPGHLEQLAYNGCDYALLEIKQHGIVRLDKNLCPIETVHTVRKYTTICYDKQLNCYWASAAGNLSTLYQLDMQFCEISKLLLMGISLHQLRGMSCDPCDGSLWLLFADAAVCVNKDSGECGVKSHRKNNRLNMGILALCGGYLVSYLEGGRQCIEVVCPGCGPCTEIAIPKHYYLKAMVLHRVCDGENPDCIYYEIALLLHKKESCELCAMELSLSCCNGVIPPCPPCPCPCPPCPPHPPCPPCPCPCPPCPPHPPHPPCPPVPPYPSCCCGKYEIMHSVALEEAGIAHILNAEGEKLQKAVATSTSIQELLCVNESVRRTITQITLLEGQLYSKLEVLSDCCKEECKYTCFRQTTEEEDE